MFRQPLLPRACLVVLGLAVSGMPAWSQDRSTYERLDRLERDLNMLQRHVYRGAPAPMVAGDGAGAVNAQIRMDRLEAQMRDLTGRIEEFMNQVEQVRRRVEQLGSDVDMRLSQAPTAPGPLNPPPGRSAGPVRPGRQPYPPAPPPEPAEDDPARPGGFATGQLMPPGYPPPGGNPNPGYSTLTPPGSSGEMTSAGPAGRSPAGGNLPSGSATEQYNYAFGLLKQANYPAAEEALKAFVETHPRDQMAGNAQFWLGETYYARARYMEAASAFAEGYKRWPKNSKAPDGLLKLGMSLARANQKQNACVALAQLDRDFPQAAASVRERAGSEKKRLGC